MREVAIQIVSPSRGMTFRQLVRVEDDNARAEMVITRELLQLIKARHVYVVDHINIIPIGPEVGFDDA
jgi:hypothetical protein